MPYLDSHIHPQALSPPDIDRLHQADICQLFCNAARQEEWELVLALAADNPSILPFIGVHPWYANLWQETSSQELAAILAGNPMVGIGEIGLDRPCGIALAVQQQVLAKQLQLALELRRPVVLHCVRYWGKLIDILSSLPSCPRFMIHGYSGSLEIMERLVALGGFISFSPRLLASDQDRLRQVYCQTPLSSLLLETDANQPGLSCQDNSCEKLAVLYFYAAKLRGIGLNEFSNIIVNNGQIYTN